MLRLCRRWVFECGMLPTAGFFSNLNGERGNRSNIRKKQGNWNESTWHLAFLGVGADYVVAIDHLFCGADWGGGV